MADALVTQLARALHLPPDAAQQTLHHLVSTLREQLDAQGEAAVPGLGTFRQAGGELTFEPEAALVRAVNHRYAGLATVASAAPLRTPHATEAAATPAGFKPLSSFIDGPEEALAEDLLAEDRLAEEPELQAEVPSLPALQNDPLPLETPPQDLREELPEPEMPGTETLTATTGADAERLDERLAGTWTEQGEAGDEPHALGPMPPSSVEDAEYSVVDPEHDPVPEDDSPVDALATVPFSAMPLPEEPVAPEPPADGLVEEPILLPDAVPAEDAVADTAAAAPVVAAPVVAETAAPTEPLERPNRAPLFAVLAVGALLAVAFLLWTQRDAPEPVAERPPVAETVPAPAVPAPSDTAAVDPAGSEPVGSEPEPVSADPLRSTGAIDPDAGGYTWVVASELSRAPAERRVEAYRAQGLRAGVVADDARGRTRYRVSLGQFDSVEDAEARRADLPGDVPSDSWILRL